MTQYEQSWRNQSEFFRNTLANLTSEEIRQAAVGTGCASRLTGNAYHQIRCGNISDAVGTMKAGAGPEQHKKTRKRLRKNLTALIEAKESV